MRPPPLNSLQNLLQSRSLHHAHISPGVGQKPSAHTHDRAQTLRSMHAGILPLGACVVLLAMISLDMVDLLRPSMLATLEMDILLLSDSSIVRLSARPSCVYSCIVPPFLLLVFFGEIDNSGKGGMLPQIGERLPNLTQPCALTLREQEWGVRLVREVSAAGCLWRGCDLSAGICVCGLHSVSGRCLNPSCLHR